MANNTRGAILKHRVAEPRSAIPERVLVIDHDDALRKILQRLFSSQGYDVDVASSGSSGLDMLRQRPPSAVILDLPHPESAGCHLCSEIATLMPGVPLVILGASADIADKVLLLEMGADEYVSIPFSPVALAKRLRILMRHASRIGRDTLYLFKTSDFANAGTDTLLNHY